MVFILILRFTATIGVNSSFNPNNNAVIYACPSDLGGFKDYQNGSATVNRNQVTDWSFEFLVLIRQNNEFNQSFPKSV